MQFVPGYFAAVMATGIVSLAARAEGFGRIGEGMFWLNVAAYLLLWALMLARLVRHGAECLGELTYHARGATYLTMVAATCVLGNQVAVFTPRMSLATGLWVFGSGLWVGLGYAFLACVTVDKVKLPLETGIDGAWLLVVVAAESVSVLGTVVAPALARTHEFLFISLAACLVGAMLWGFLTTLIFYRWIFFRLKPEQLKPNYWINMGALAITTLACAHLQLAAGQWDRLRELAPLLMGLTVFFWAAGTWWLPLLMIVGIWRQLGGHLPLRYDPDNWSMVFPLGMYTLATAKAAQASGVSFLAAIPPVFIYVALAAWAMTFAGLVHRVAQGCLRAR